MRHNININKK